MVQDFRYSVIVAVVVVVIVVHLPVVVPKFFRLEVPCFRAFDVSIPSIPAALSVSPCNKQ